uniref:DUF3444 domain-containing protein n=1 Tax=Haemonchus contortus TaxID=6289 RepID=A0A7I4YET6_HAECO
MTPKRAAKEAASKKVKRSASPKADKKKSPSPSPNPSPSPENKGSVKKVKKKKSPIIDPSDSRKLKKKKDPPSEASESKKRKQNDLERLYREDHTFFKVIVGYFKARMGPRRTAEELHIGTHGMEWNEQMPSHLRWTWESPGGQFHNEIDHIILYRRFCLTDNAVVPKLYMESDHRLLRTRFCFSVRGERAMKFKKGAPRSP